MRIPKVHMAKAAIALVSSVAMLGSMAACGSSNGASSEDSDGEVTLRFSTWNKEADDGELIKTFEEKNPNIKIEPIRIEDSDYSQKVNQMVVGGTAPDVMVQFETDLPRFAEAGVIENLDPYIEKSDIDTSDFIPAVTELAKTTNGNYGLPWSIGIEILYYNQDMFDEAGVEKPTNDWTWNDFEQAAQKLTKSEGGKTTQWGADALTFRGLWWSLAGEGGDKIVSDGKLDLGDGLKAALEYQNRLTNELKVSPPPQTGSSVSDLFSSGQAAMARNGNWMIGSYRDLPFKWDIATLPKGEEAYNSLHTGFYSINASSEHKEAAWKFIDFLMSKEGQKINSSTGGNPPGFTSMAKEGWNRNPGKNGPTNWEAIDKSVADGRFGYTLVNASATTNLTNDFDAYLLGAKTLDEIFDNSIPAANKEIEDAQ